MADKNEIMGTFSLSTTALELRRQTINSIKLGTEMYIENTLIKWYIHRLHCHPQRERRTGMI